MPITLAGPRYKSEDALASQCLPLSDKNRFHSIPHYLTSPYFTLVLDLTYALIESIRPKLANSDWRFMVHQS